jgi:glycerol-3-phosphate acyltransferase PlsX
MGGDRAPGEIVLGARRAAEKFGVSITLVGRANELGDTGDLEVFEASEVIEMTDEPGAAIRRKKDSSLVRCAELVRDGKASAMISAGNTGATMGSALLRIGRIKGVSRPAVATPIPVPGSTPTTLLDAGANAECQPEWLVQFAQMGSAYARTRFGIDAPKVGLLSIGEESTKGNSLVKEVHALLAATSGLNFVGNVEGRDIMTTAVDVVVTDGFTGNVVLKALEGGMGAIVKGLLEAFSATEESRAARDQLMPALLDFYAVMNPDTYGGAVLLGTDGLCVIGHGASNADAIVNAVGVTTEMVRHDLVSVLKAAVAPAA